MSKRTPPLVLALLFATQAVAGPEDPSRFVTIDYGPQKVLYEFNFAEPKDGLAALGFIRNHIEALKKHGDLAGSKFVIVAHGNELHAYSRKNRAAFPEAYKLLKDISDQASSFGSAATRPAPEVINRTNSMTWQSQSRPR